MTSLRLFSITAIVAVLYLLPFVVAFTRRRPGWGGLLVLNIAIGWTVIGWIAVLVWAFSSPPVAKARDTHGRRAFVAYLRDFGRAKVETVVFASPQVTPGVVSPPSEPADGRRWPDEVREPADPYADWLSTKHPG